jgi:hypothetical protein
MGLSRRGAGASLSSFRRLIRRLTGRGLGSDARRINSMNMNRVPLNARRAGIHLGVYGNRRRMLSIWDPAEAWRTMNENRGHRVALEKRFSSVRVRKNDAVPYVAESEQIKRDEDPGARKAKPNASG